MIPIHTKTKIIISILMVIAVAGIVTFGLKSYQAKKVADKEDRKIELKLEQAKNEFRLHLKSFPEDKRLSEIDDVNILLEPTEQTFKLLKRWELVHQVEPNYPYPQHEIEEQDWMGINYFLYGDLDDEEGAAKAEMTYDENNNIDSDISDYIMSNIESQDPVVLEAIDRMEDEK